MIGGAPHGPFNFKAILQEMIRQNASDLHLKVGRPPTVRVQGQLAPLSHPAMRPEDLKSLAEQVMSPRQVKEFAENKEADFAIGVPGIGRFRVNVYQQRGTIAYAMRSIPYQTSTVEELNLPKIVTDIALRPRGLVLITNFAQDNFHQILHSDEAGSVAVLIHYNHHVSAFGLHLAHQVVHRLGFGNEANRPH